MGKEKKKKNNSNEPSFVTAFAKGDIFTKLSAPVFGLGCFVRGQIARGIILLGFEALFFWYLINKGLYWITMLPSLGKQGPESGYDEFRDVYTTIYHDNSFKILLYGVLTIFLIVAFIYTISVSVKMSYAVELKKKNGQKIDKLKDDLRSLVDEKFYKTLLSLPCLGIFVFTFLPIVFMVLVSFTNYDGAHDGYTTGLFSWVGIDNFKTLFSSTGGNGSYFKIFTGILGWTVVWAIVATLSNYILGILVAMMINKKGIRFKKLWRTIFVMTIAIPQFISLMYVSKMFDKTGLVNGFMTGHGIWSAPIDFWGTPWLARVMVIIINIWIGIPYMILIASGILMNIPADLYESARIDGANPFQQFRYITMPYMLFVTAPYLLTNFTGNMNNFNVIYLLSGGGPGNAKAGAVGGGVGHTDLLITWLFKLTQGTEAAYYMASVLGIVIFIIVATVTLLVYNRLGSNKNEEDFA